MATIFCPITHISPEDFERATRVTYLGAVWGTMAALKRMKPRDRGTIVQVGSALAYRSIPLQGPYCGAKSAMRGFTDSLRSELIHDGSRVHITMVHLSAFNTPQFDWGKTCFNKQPQPLPPGRRDNLHEPVPGNHGAHRRFDSRASSFSWQLWLTTHRAAAVVTGLVVLVLLAFLLAAALKA